MAGPLTPAAFVRNLTALFGLSAAEADELVVRFNDLTDRQTEVAALMAAGRGNRAIAAALGISPKTLDIHRAALQRTLGVTTAAGVCRAWALWAAAKPALAAELATRLPRPAKDTPARRPRRAREAADA
jgi:DNA-binding NarL/FixJ family response regulator